MIVDLSPSILPRILDEDTTRALAEGLSPWEKSSPGDLLALEIGLRLPAGATTPVSTGAITLHCRSETGILPGSYRSLMRGGVDNLLGKAHIAMVAAGDPVLERTVEPGLLAMNPANGEDFHARAFLLSSCVAVTHDDLDWVIEDSETAIEEIDFSELIDVVTTSTASQHERIARQVRFHSDMTILSRILAVADEDGAPIAFTAHLPA